MKHHLHWYRHVFILLLEWMAALIILANLTFLIPGPSMGLVRVTAPFVGSVFLTRWFRRWLQKGAQE